MPFCTLMTVKLPPDLPAEKVQALRAAETALAQDYQRQGKLRHLWRVAGRAANVSVWDCVDADDFHATVSALPLFPYLEIEVLPLARHPSALD
ncbi:muconolactone Delta-isomerase family protein [Cupriavidus basilensis]|uniref:muconolactone Delta-isomerase family protein n=1 Tax=Cupriavidus basilensis TaxID=68895 RepID=UPI0023E79E76|nr:muconolactone Delta-isomerase family protein [Cupriavidus basilensis]MDF3883027.1 muconolactone Delta-isomerase family protein [Cupriavidus basilensis]